MTIKYTIPLSTTLGSYGIAVYNNYSANFYSLHIC